MAQDTDQPAAAAVGEHPAEDDGHTEEAPVPVHEDAEDHDGADLRLTRRVHVVLGLVVAALGAWLLYLSHTELAFRGENHEPGPGYLPVLLTIGLVVLGLALTGAWLFGPRARSGDAPTLSLEPHGMARAGLVWLALVVCAFLIEPLGFLVAGEVLVLLVIVVIERMRSIPSIVALLLVPPAMYLLFATLLEVQLPEGTLWR